MTSTPTVALLAEGVDRNQYAVRCVKAEQVALLAEDVDRNLPNMSSRSAMVCRPPRGGRG